QSLSRGFLTSDRPRGEPETMGLADDGALAGSAELLGDLGRRHFGRPVFLERLNALVRPQVHAITPEIIVPVCIGRPSGPICPIRMANPDGLVLRRTPSRPVETAMR